MKILLGMSGGLDSTYSAVLLKEAGYSPVGCGVIMHSFTDVKAAKQSADEVGIPFVTVNAEEKFQSEVVDDFVQEYCHGRTPNPCVRCNPYVKIASLCEYAEKNGFEKVATGHYASVGFENGRYFIIEDKKSGKDQSYVLWMLNQKQLSMLYFPLCGYQKPEIRKKAEEMSLTASGAEDSQEICFIPDNDYPSFIKNRTGKTFPEGNFISPDGKILGKHSGIINYTVGKRKGLGIALGERMYVSNINPEDNTVTLCPYSDREINFVYISSVNLMKADGSENEINGFVRVRYSAKPIPCTVNIGEGKIILHEAIKSASPGQSAVVYDEEGGILLGGLITKTE